MDWFPSYTQCSSPSGWYKVPAAWMAVVGGAGLAALIAAGIAGAWAPGVAALLAAACLSAILFCTWWLNIRLICLGGDRSAVGAIYHLEPPAPTLNPFAFGSYDTDYSFNLLLWQFVPKHALPATFVNNQWSAAAEGQLGTDWGTLPPLVPNVPFAGVQSEVERIIPQQTMASLGLSLVGQNIEDADQPNPALAGGTSQHFLLHCEIEGPGMRDLRTLLWVLFGVFVAAAALSAIPVIGSALAWILSILAFLAFLIGGAAITHDDASPPTGGGWGGTFNSWERPSEPGDKVDLAYVYGRWVYDSLHDGWNELHPLHFMIKIGDANKGDLQKGDWPGDLGEKQHRYDELYTGINDPGTPAKQAQPPNDWTVHPVLDGCDGGDGYPTPDPNEVIK
jgi:hypothetical protein